MKNDGSVIMVNLNVSNHLSKTGVQGTPAGFYFKGISPIHAAIENGGGESLTANIILLFPRGSPTCEGKD